MKDSMNNKAYYNSTVMGNFIEGNVNESGDTVMVAMNHLCSRERYKNKHDKGFAPSPAMFDLFKRIGYLE